MSKTVDQSVMANLLARQDRHHRLLSWLSSVQNAPSGHMTDIIHFNFFFLSFFLSNT